MATVNLILYDWATIVSKLLSGDQTYKIGGMYIEFENNGGAAITAPTPLRDDGISYYDGLALDAYRDYLRVPIIAVTPSSSDSSLFPGGNELTFFAQTQGVAGVHGKPFTADDSSIVYGGAVAIPDAGDRTQDLVFNRFYLPVEQHQVKLANSQLGVNIRLQFE